MRRFGPVSAILCVVSLLFFVATCAIWARSYQAHDWARYRREDFAEQLGNWQLHLYRKTGYELHSAQGWLVLLRFAEFHQPIPGWPRQPPVSWQHKPAEWRAFSDTEFPRKLRGYGQGGLGLEGGAEESVMLSIHYGVLAVAMLVIPFVCAMRLRRKLLRSRRGFCWRCTYDLRAHGNGERCPECGTLVAQADSTADARG